MSSTARMDRARLGSSTALGGAPPGSAGRTAAGGGRGRRGRQRELNTQIGAAELADGAKGTVRTWQERCGWV